MELSNLRPAEVLSTVTGSGEAGAMVQETVRLPARDTKARRPVPELPGSVLKADRCLCTDVSPREVLPIEIQRKSLLSMSVPWSVLRTGRL